MTEGVDLKVSKLSTQIEKIQSKIEHVNTVTNEAIAKLEIKKRELRGSISEDLVIQKNIRDLTVGHDRVIEKLLQTQLLARDKKASLDQLDYTIYQLDREISRITSEREQILLALRKKREELLNILKSIDELTVQIKELDRNIDLLTERHEMVMDKLMQEKENIINRDDLTPSEKDLLLAELEQRIQEEKEMYQLNLSSLQRQKEESLMMQREYDEETVAELTKNLLSEIEGLEAMKEGASPSEIEEINEKIAQLREHLEDVETLGKLKARGLRITPSGRIATDTGEIYTVKEAMERGLLDGINVNRLILKSILNQKGLHMTKSGNLTTPSGNLLTMEQAQDVGLLSESFMEAFHIGAKTRSSLSVSSETPSNMSSEDVNYLKTTVGKPLTLALAEICSKQPRDPIHYLGHWLFKYRYNQEIDEVKKREVEALIEERERVRLEAWHKEVEDAARAAVMEMIFKAHDEAMQHELNTATTLEETEEENDELAEEAKDVLGEYTGPSAGQRRI